MNANTLFNDVQYIFSPSYIKVLFQRSWDFRIIIILYVNELRKYENSSLALPHTSYSPKECLWEMHCVDFIFDSLPSSYTNLVGKPTTKIEAPKPSKEAYQVFYFLHSFPPLKTRGFMQKWHNTKGEDKKITILNQYLTCYTSIFVYFLPSKICVFITNQVFVANNINVGNHHFLAQHIIENWFE